MVETTSPTTKSCNEEGGAPTQILLNARSWRYCVLSDLGMWLKFCFEFGNNGNSYMFGVVDKDGPIKIKESVAYLPPLPADSGQGLGAGRRGCGR